MKKIFTISIAIYFCSSCFCQNIGMGTLTPHASAALDISSASKGLLIPRMTSTGISAIANPAKGLMLYDSIKNQVVVNMGTAAIPNWQNIVSGNSWGLTGNSGTDTAVNFIGTTDSIPLYFRINNQPAGRIDSGYNNRTGSLDGNTFLGYAAGKYKNAGAFYNTGFGYQALDSLTIGDNNTAFGVQAMNTTYTRSDRNLPSDNTAVGFQSIYKGVFLNPNSNAMTGFQAGYQVGGANIGVGYQADYKGGGGNTAVGAQALLSPEFSGNSGYDNVASGATALYHNKSVGPDASGDVNIANGYASLYTNRFGYSNIADGYQALYKNFNGKQNVAFGVGALYSNDDNSGSFNIAGGAYSLINTTSSQGNIALGYNAGHAFDNGYYNSFIGAETDANGAQYYNTIAVGHGTLVTAPNMMRVGNGATTSVGGQVKWSVISDGRVKQHIRENVPGLAFVNLLKPLTYNIDLASIDRIVKPSNGENTPTTRSGDAAEKESSIEKVVPAQMEAAFRAKEQIVYSGFVAQDVERAAMSMHYNFSGVDAPKNDKDLYGLRYASFVVPLVKAVQELSFQYSDLKKQNEKLLQQKDQALQQLAALEQKAH